MYSSGMVRVFYMYRYEQSVALRDASGKTTDFLLNKTVTFVRIILSPVCQRTNECNLKSEILTAICNIHTYCHM